ncbi:MAG: hypothetical protein WAU53_18610 [Rhodoplanes sp.]
MPVQASKREDSTVCFTVSPVIRDRFDWSCLPVHARFASDSDRNCCTAPNDREVQILLQKSLDEQKIAPHVPVIDN